MRLQGIVCGRQGGKHHTADGGSPTGRPRQWSVIEEEVPSLGAGLELKTLGAHQA